MYKKSCNIRGLRKNLYLKIKYNKKYILDSSSSRWWCNFIAKGSNCKVGEPLGRCFWPDCTCREKLCHHELQLAVMRPYSDLEIAEQDEYYSLCMYNYTGDNK